MQKCKNLWIIIFALSNYITFLGTFIWSNKWKFFRWLILYIHTRLSIRWNIIIIYSAACKSDQVLHYFFCSCRGGESDWEWMRGHSRPQTHSQSASLAMAENKGKLNRLALSKIARSRCRGASTFRHKTVIWKLREFCVLWFKNFLSLRIIEPYIVERYNKICIKYIN